jgi:preprotein translocase subunit SecG
MTTLLVLQIIVVVALIGVILMQKSSGDGFTGSGNPTSFLTAKGSANLLTRTTAILATLFIVNSLVLAFMASHTKRGDSIIEDAISEKTAPLDAADTKAAPAAAKAPQEKDKPVSAPLGE